MTDFGAEWNANAARLVGTYEPSQEHDACGVGLVAALDGRKREIERTILLFGESIKQKVFANLRTYLDEMHDTWVEDSHHLIDLDGAISIKSLLASYTQREAREQKSDPERGGQGTERSEQAR